RSQPQARTSEESAVPQFPSGMDCRSLPALGMTKKEQTVGGYCDVKCLYCAAVSGTTDNRPCRTRGDSANILLALTSASVTGFAIGFPALIFTLGFLGSLASTDTTEAVPTALL